MTESPTLLSCVLIPVSPGWLLLPNVAIAEIVDRPEQPGEETGITGVAGFCQWRGLRLPMVSWEAANGLATEEEEEASGRGGLLILNSIGEHHERMPFLALLTRGIPRQAKIEPSQLHPLEGEKGPADTMIVDFDGERAVIPDLEHLESLALASLPEDSLSKE